MADYNPLTPLGRVRFLVSDTATEASGDRIFSDDEITATIENEGGIKYAAAQLMEIIADNEALLGKKITTQDLSTDGPAVATSLRARAASLRDQAAVDAESASGDDGVAFVPYGSTYYPAELAEWPIGHVIW